jgi:Ca2+/Na+ antiporter
MEYHEQRQDLGRSDARASMVAFVTGLLLLVGGTLMWVTGARSLADLAALGQVLVGLSFVRFVASCGYGSSSRWWRFGGGPR